ncbi:YegS/Rv2252/BmrU family lipid kinase [Tissierella sp. Yu-01]|uniref:diacylglycerol/lipid kinase family protein n=1 Tax=Tissierella sp. Yu-01 TaxID=3035694 RepID=UPI00240E8C23|nr:YegS/Rv2252/BmrU family lipid kinase [Tissierella sp. Yu-01]WFA09437.1 YegS/Rv2252/BmrU family lipid kinase [Tissierella sp. Yu-01]
MKIKSIKFIINPSSGRQAMERKIDVLCKMLLDDGYIVAKYFTEEKYDAMLEAKRTCNSGFDLIVACGGDGTVNEVVKGVMNSERKIPVSILASGTVNDFARYLNLPRTPSDFYKMIKRENLIYIDIGKVNDDYFVNVAAGGLLTNVGYQVQPDMKAILGRMAYYFEGIKELTQQNLEPIRVKINSEEYSSQEDILIFLVSNSSSIGGFKKLAPEADVLDGLLDVVIIKKSAITDLANIFVNILTGDHINHPNVIYYKTKAVLIESEKEISIDVDGEYGGKLPAKFQVIPKGLQILI